MLLCLNYEASPGMSESKSYVPDSNDDLVPKSGATSTTSNKTQYTAKYARKLKLLNHLRQKKNDAAATYFSRFTIHTWVSLVTAAHCKRTMGKKCSIFFSIVRNLIIANLLEIS